MAIDTSARTYPQALPLPAHGFDLPAPITERRCPVAVPLDRAWLARRAVRLDPRRHPSISGPTAVSAILRAVPVPDVRHVAPAGVRLEPRSMTAAPFFRTTRHARTAELVGTLSTVLDTAERLPAGHAVATAYLAVRLATAASLSDRDCSDLLYAGLLKDAGSTGHGAPGASGPVPAYLAPENRLVAVLGALGLPRGLADIVIGSSARWAPSEVGRPHGEGIPATARILAIAAAIAAPLLRGATSEAERTLRADRGDRFDPALVDLALGIGKLGLWADVAAPDAMARLLAVEPGHLARVSDDAAVDAVAMTFGDLVDTRTPRLGRHGARVAQQAQVLADELHLPSSVARDLRRAAHLHDVGKLLVPIAILEKPGPLSGAERRVVDQHAAAGAAVLARGPFSAAVARMVAVHHERLDGSGDLSGFADEASALAARVLAIADRYVALCSERPYRAALPPDQALRVLEGSVRDPLALLVLDALGGEALRAAA